MWIERANRISKSLEQLQISIEIADVCHAINGATVSFWANSFRKQHGRWPTAAEAQLEIKALEAKRESL